MYLRTTNVPANVALLLGQAGRHMHEHWGAGRQGSNLAEGFVHWLQVCHHETCLLKEARQVGLRCF